MRKVTIHLRDEDFDKWWKWYIEECESEIEYDKSRSLIWEAETVSQVEELMEHGG